jgi:hypothetical protein
MDVRRRVALMSIVGGLSLAAGIPLLGLSATTDGATAEGDIVRVDLAAHTMSLHDTGSEDSLRGQDITVHLPTTGVTVEPGHRPLGTLRAGQHVRIVIGVRSHWAREITRLGG